MGDRDSDKGGPGAALLSITEDNGEMAGLLHTLGYRVVLEAVQRRDSPDQRLFLGPGRIEALLRDLSWPGVELVAVNGMLSPAQVFRLNRALDKPVFDRTGIILEIFLRKAHSRAANLQVTLARLRHQAPMVREWIHRARSGEHPGLFFSGGEPDAERYYEIIRRRMSAIRRDLETIRRQGSGNREHRRKCGFHIVSLAGYTGAGKTTLLNALCGAGEPVANTPFTTLSTITRAVRTDPGTGKKGESKKILLTDTVGFISGLPPWLVEAFRATMEEIMDADALMVIVDSSEGAEVSLAKYGTVTGILATIFGEAKKAVPPVVVVLTKKDLAHELMEVRKALESRTVPFPILGFLEVAAISGSGMAPLISALRDVLPAQREKVRTGAPGSREQKETP